MTDTKQIEWRIIGETVPGASHLRAGIPNQDAILQMRESGRTPPLVISIADGHGSAKCFRSDFGSRFAVKKAVQIVGEFLDQRRGKFDLPEISAQGEDYLPKEFVKKWRKTVEYHLKNNPFTAAEFKKLEEKSGANARALIEENPLLAYGTTSLTVAVEDDFMLLMQLGDGAILNISAAGEVSIPLPEDARLLANETTSMCLKDAEKDFRFLVQQISPEESPALVLLSTDGYFNSFADEAGFFQAGTDILKMLATENGGQAVAENLKGWLAEATSQGSGDDCTVGLLYRPDLLKKPDDGGEKLETVSVVETPLSPETSQAIDVLTDSQFAARDDLQNVTVTITIRKDKNHHAAGANSPNEPAPAPETAGETEPNE